MCISVNLDKACDYANKVNVYDDGKISVYTIGDKPFEEVINGWKCMICGAHDMPAFGVSLNKETVKALNSGLWVEFIYDKQYESNGMPFEKLLVNVQKGFYGFNIIRYNSDSGYDGRCFYYDLVGQNMDSFYDILSNL